MNSAFSPINSPIWQMLKIKKPINNATMQAFFEKNICFSCQLSILLWWLGENELWLTLGTHGRHECSHIIWWMTYFHHVPITLKNTRTMCNNSLTTDKSCVPLIVVHVQLKLDIKINWHFSHYPPHQLIFIYSRNFLPT